MVPILSVPTTPPRRRGRSAAPVRFTGRCLRQSHDVAPMTLRHAEVGRLETDARYEAFVPTPNTASDLPVRSSSTNEVKASVLLISSNSLRRRPSITFVG